MDFINREDIEKILDVFASQLSYRYDTVQTLLANDIAVTRFMTTVGVGTSVNFCEYFFPDLREKKLYVPCRLLVGPSASG